MEQTGKVSARSLRAAAAVQRHFEICADVKLRHELETVQRVRLAEIIDRETGTAEARAALAKLTAHLERVNQYGNHSVLTDAVISVGRAALRRLEGPGDA